MRGLIRRLTFRRLEMSFGSVVIIGLTGLMWQKGASEEGIWIAIFILEFMLPITAGMITSGLLAGDPVIELLMSASRSAARILLERLTTVVGLGSLLAGLVMFVAKLRLISLPQPGIEGLFTWLSPMLFFAGVGTTGALLRGRMVDGVIAVIVIAVIMHEHRVR